MNRFSIDTSYLGELPPQLDEKELDELVDRLCHGEPVHNRIVEGHLRLAVAKAATMTRKAPHRGDDFLGVSFYKTVEAVERFPRVAKDVKITPYISTTVWFGLLHELMAGSSIRIPKSTINHHIRNGTLEKVLVSYESLTDETEVLLTEKKARRLAAKPHFKLETQEIIDLAARTEEERTIFNMRLAGYTDKEIATVVSRSVSYVHNVRHVVYDRFRYFWEL